MTLVDPITHTNQGVVPPSSGWKRKRRIEDVVRRYRRTLLGAARQWSLCSHDAEDAYQRAIEIYLNRIDSLDPRTELAWLKVVIRHEAMAIRKARQQIVSDDEVDLDAQIAENQRSVEEQFESRERVGRSKEVIARLKRDEAQALMLKAEGHSYAEISKHFGWTYTKVNRCITQGRKQFRKVYEGISNGSQCEEFAPILNAIVSAKVSNAQLLEVRPHLRHCSRCRATLRSLHSSRFERVAAALGLPSLLDACRDFKDKGLSAVVDGCRGVKDRLRDDAANLFHRVSGNDVTSSVQMASASGGGRISSVAAIIGVCVSGGAGGYCLSTGLPPTPSAILKAVTGDQESNEAAQEKQAATTPKVVASLGGQTTQTSGSQPIQSDSKQPEAANSPSLLVDNDAIGRNTFQTAPERFDNETPHGPDDAKPAQFGDTKPMPSHKLIAPNERRVSRPPARHVGPGQATRGRYPARGPGSRTIGPGGADESAP